MKNVIRVMAHATALALALSSPAWGLDLSHEHVPGELIVKFKSAAMPKEIEALGVLHTINGAGLAKLALASGKSSTELIAAAKAIESRPDVVFVEPNYVYRTQLLPNDPKFAETYGLHNEGGTGGTIDADIDAPEAWELTTGSRDIVVAVIDTGIDYSHPDLMANIWTNPGESGEDEQGRDRRSNGVDDDGNGYVDDWRGYDFVNNDADPMDDNRHGTHCAGTIGASGNDNVGVAGVAWEVSLVGVKFLSGGGSGTLENAVKAINYATGIGVDIMSNSWGGGGFSEALLEAIQAAEAAGILFVAAAGNNGRNNDTSPTYPANYDVANVLAVAATDHNDELASFSNYGARTVHIAAPGVDIMSTLPNNEYGNLSGTSMATPHVAGAAALMLSVAAGKHYGPIKERLIATADLKPSVESKVLSGGRLNVANAVEIDEVPPGEVTDIEVQGVSMMGAILSFASAGDDGDEGFATSYEVRTSVAPITTEEQWLAARLATSAIQLDRERRVVVATISGLPAGFSGHLAVQAIDNLGNRGGISASVAITLAEASILRLWDGDSLDGATAVGGFGIETLADGRVVYSDSPNGDYADYANTFLQLDAFEITTREIVLELETHHVLATAGDFGQLQVSFNDEVQWQTVREFRGNSDGFQTVTVALYGMLPDDARKVTLRFLFLSDFRGTAAGWLIDNVAIKGPAE